ncbi:MAG TPA: tetratricopeptide repeat protein [Bryobacteraceae bacterium]|nr:tetratricopeptide repeat protein [Bryobacteraceae bacterium]
MFCRRLTFCSSILIALIAGGCARRPNPVPTVERLAVLPLENLSSDPQLNWFARGSAAVVEYDLAGAKNIFAKNVESISAAQSMQATRVLEGYFFERNGRLGIRATLEDLRTTRAVQHFELDGSVANGFLPLANELAQRLSSEVRPFGTANENAFRFYGDAITATDAEARERAIESAIAADPGFAAVYGLRARTGARDRALQMIQAGEQGRVDSIDRADLQYIAAAVSGDRNSQIQALETLTRVTPANATLFADLGAAQFARRNFPEAVRNYQEASILNPEEPRIWNELGYALAWTRNLQGARRALQEYQRLAPDDANALDSLGEVSFFLGDFESSAKYFERAAQRSRAEFLKAAEARLMLGDLGGADAFFAKYAAGLRREAAAYQLAQWQFLTGRKNAGIAAMKKLTTEPDSELQKLARRQLAVWEFEAGDSNVSADIPGLEAAYQKANPSNDGQIRVLLASALLARGSVDRAANLIELCPLPLSSGDPMFASSIFPQYFELRAAVFEKQGKPEEAKKNRELYHKYGGADVTK